MLYEISRDDLAHVDLTEGVLIGNYRASRSPSCRSRAGTSRRAGSRVHAGLGQALGRAPPVGPLHGALDRGRRDPRPAAGMDRDAARRPDLRPESRGHGRPPLHRRRPDRPTAKRPLRLEDLCPPRRARSAARSARGGSRLGQASRRSRASSAASSALAVVVAEQIDAGPREARGPPRRGADRARGRAPRRRARPAAPARACGRASARTGARPPRRARPRAGWRRRASARRARPRRSPPSRAPGASASLIPASARRRTSRVKIGSASARAMARSASSDSTLVVPSQIGSTCASRRSSGRPVSST